MKNTESIEVVKPLNLYQKLLEIQRKINGLGKDKDTKTNSNPGGYKFVTGDKILSHIKPLMNDLGIILKQEIIKIENQRQDYFVTGKKWEEVNGKNTCIEYPKPKAEIFTTLHLKFTWIDCDTGEKDENLFFANGQNDWEKGLGSALTYGERYFLLKFFHIATDEDDIDNPDRKTVETIKQSSAQKEEPQEYLIPGSETETISISLYEEIIKIDHQNIPLANKILTKISGESKAVRGWFNIYCNSKAMKYDSSTKQFEPMGIAA